MHENAAFEAAAIRAVTAWRFEPSLLDGKPVPVRMNLTIRFDVQ